MPKFNVTINRTRTIEYTAEVEVTAKDEDGAEEKVEEKLDKAIMEGNLEKAFNWYETRDDEDVEFDVSEA